jgi:uncharacterized protein YbjT (DUF2867 family)
MFFVAGITGHVGGATARTLLEKGHKLRTLARDPKKAAAWEQKGVEVRQGDFNDPGAVAGALKGVDGAYLMLPPVFTPALGFPEAKGYIASYREALRKAPPPRLAVLSSIGSEQTSGLGLIAQTHLLEEGLSEFTFPIAFVRAGVFLENFTFALKSAASGWFDSFLAPTSKPVPMIATADIGKEVARLLAGGWSGRKIVEIGSPFSPDDVAAALGKVLGREVKARAIARQQWAAVLQSQGMPAGSTSAFEEMEDGFNSDLIKFGVAGAERVAATITPEEFFRRAKAHDGA